MATLEFKLLDEDLNGSIYAAAGEGEVLVSSEAQTWIFPMSWPSMYLDVNGQPGHIGVRYIGDEPNIVLDHGVLRTENYAEVVKPMMQEMFELNTRYLMHFHVNSREAQLISLMRTLMAREGLVHPSYVPADFHVHYSEALFVDAVAPEKMAVLKPAKRDFGPTEAARVRSSIIDAVSCVACMFRTKGHHYLDSLEVAYNRLWAKTGKDNLLVSWRSFATIGMHAIFPELLDEFWVRMARRGCVSGAIAKRIASAAAGSAATVILHTAVTELQTTLPEEMKTFQDGVAAVEEAHDAIRDHRWAGSINARYYGVQKKTLDERRASALAASVMALLETIDPSSQLLNSPALRRVAQISPIVGAFARFKMMKIVESHESGPVSRGLIRKG